MGEPGVKGRGLHNPNIALRKLAPTERRAFFVPAWPGVCRVASGAYHVHIGQFLMVFTPARKAESAARLIVRKGPYHSKPAAVCLFLKSGQVGTWMNPVPALRSMLTHRPDCSEPNGRPSLDVSGNRVEYYHKSDPGRLGPGSGLCVNEVAFEMAAEPALQVLRPRFGRNHQRRNQRHEPRLFGFCH